MRRSKAIGKCQTNSHLNVKQPSSFGVGMHYLGLCSLFFAKLLECRVALCRAVLSSEHGVKLSIIVTHCFIGIHENSVRELP